MISFSQIESWSCNGTKSVNSYLVLCPHVEQKWYSLPIWDTICAKHDFTVTKRAHAIKLLCKNVIETFNSKDFFSVLVTNYFSILKYFSWFRNIFLDFKFFFLDFIFFFFLTPKFFSWFWKIFLDYESFFSMAAIGHHTKLYTKTFKKKIVSLVEPEGKMCRLQKKEKIQQTFTES